MYFDAGWTMDQAKKYLKDKGIRWKNFINVKMNVIEKRILNAEFRVQNIEGQDMVEGEGAIYNSWSEDLGGFREMILPGAFDNADLTDVRVLKNHNPDLILGRTTAKTAEVYPTERGLAYKYQDGGTSYGKDLLISLKRGDVTQSSFAFNIAEGGDSWTKTNEGTYERRISAFAKIYDVSPVTFPAYPDTSVAKRSIEGLESKELEVQKANEARDQAIKDQEETERILREIELNSLSDK